MRLEVGAVSDGVPNSLVERIAAVRREVAAAASAAGRDFADIVIVGVTKRHDRDAVLGALAAGLGDIAENYVQEAVPKYAGLPPGVRKHFVGHIQTNKAKAIVETFDVVQSIDRLDAGRAIAKAERALGKRVKVLLQLNISPTERFGLQPEEAPELARRLRDDEGLDVDGVMAIGPVTQNREEIACAFALAAKTFAMVGGTTLSLGMSGDFREAIACGSTMVRIGTAIFGVRG
jgi:pyridoxal phosphate enzyme (YggS family)